MQVFDELKAEISDYKKFRAGNALAMTLSLAHQAGQFLSVHHDAHITLDVEQLIESQYRYWEKFSAAMLMAQDEYVGASLGRSHNKADHSREVAEGVSLMFNLLACRAGYSISEKEINYIKFRAYLHDGGRILNLTDQCLNDKRDEMRGKSAREIAAVAAHKIVQHYGDAIGAENDIRDAICFTAISAREGPLYVAAVSHEPDVELIRSYYHKENVHNPIYLDGLHNFISHHNRPGSPPNSPENFSGITEYGVVDHLSILIDKASACTGRVNNLDEVAMHLVFCAKHNMCDPSYVRYFLESYGSGSSPIELWYASCIEKKISRIPMSSITHINPDKLLYALEHYKIPALEFPGISGPWSSVPKPQDRLKLSRAIKRLGNVPAVICEDISQFPPLTVERIKRELMIVQAKVSGVRRADMALKSDFLLADDPR